MRSYPSTAKSERSQRLEQFLVSLLAGILALACVAVGGLSLYNAGYFSPGFSSSYLTATAAAECQQIIAQAMQASGSYCEQIGPNNVCYGNITIQAELIPGSTAPFAQRGDIINIQELRSLSAAPLNLNRDEWGIAIFKVMANLPDSLPGENITMVVFGNTTIDTPNQSLESFYFTSELGQILCEAVPFDGIMINVPDGTGIQFTVNGTQVILTGNASLRAEANEALQIAIYTGSALVTANGQQQLVGAGQGVSVPLGGPNGNEAVGPPSAPYDLSPNEIALACTMTGQYCSGDVIPTMGIETVIAILGPNFPGGTPNGTPTGMATATGLLAQTATRAPNLPSPTSRQATQPPATQPPATQPPATQPPPPPPTDVPVVTICHCAQASQTSCSTLTVQADGTYGGHSNHQYDIIPAPPEGCP